MSLEGVPDIHQTKLWKRLHVHGLLDMGSLCEDLGTKTREIIKNNYSISDVNILEDIVDNASGGRKLTIDLGYSRPIETVVIPRMMNGKKTSTVCVSSQTGCTLTCAFCATGQMTKGSKLSNISTSGIVSQVMAARRVLGQYSGTPKEVSTRQTVSNIVFMGMGEPGYNSRNVLQASSILSCGRSKGISKGRILISTSGVIPFMSKVTNDGYQLALSLHAADDDLRSYLVPLNKRWNINELLTILTKWYPVGMPSSSQRVMIEYTLIKDVNDSPSQAIQLAEVLAPIHCHLNIIPFNTVQSLPFESPTADGVQFFKNVFRDKSKTLVSHPISVSVRLTMGTGIDAACGQLSLQVEKHTKTVVV